MKKIILGAFMALMPVCAIADGDHHHHGVISKDQFISELAKIHACVQQKKMPKEDADTVILPHAEAYAMARFTEKEQREIQGRSHSQSKKVFIHMGWACDSARQNLMKLKVPEKKKPATTE